MRHKTCNLLPTELHWYYYYLLRGLPKELHTIGTPVHQNVRSLYQTAQLDIRNRPSIRHPSKSHHRLRTDAKKRRQRQQVAAGLLKKNVSQWETEVRNARAINGEAAQSPWPTSTCQTSICHLRGTRIVTSKKVPK
jgi:hypothetical protein